MTAIDNPFQFPSLQAPQRPMNPQTFAQALWPTTLCNHFNLQALDHRHLLSPRQVSYINKEIIAFHYRFNVEREYQAVHLSKLYKSLSTKFSFLSRILTQGSIVYEISLVKTKSIEICHIQVKISSFKRGFPNIKFKRSLPYGRSFGIIHLFKKNCNSQ